jgi:hypothetical protein
MEATGPLPDRVLIMLLNRLAYLDTSLTAFPPC